MLSKRGLGTLVAMAALLLITESIFAQQGGRGRGGFGMRGRGGIMLLVSNEAVQKEISLGDQEKEKLTAIVQKYGEEMRGQLEGAGGGQNPTAEERQKFFAKMQEVNQKLTEKYLPSIKEVLKPEQFTRVQQISWQASGSSAFADPDLAKALDLSKEQQEKITAINQEYQQKQTGLFGGGENQNFQEVFAKMRELGQERDKKAEEVLTKDQQSKFTELKGKAFDLSQLQGQPNRKRGDN